MYRSLVFAFFAITLLTGCFMQTDKIQVLTAQPDDYELYLYTEPDQEEAAQNYLSALLDWKLKQDDGEKLNFQQSAMNSTKVNFSQDDLPVLVVKQEGKTISTISGENPRQEILMTLEDSITFAKK